MTINFNKYNFEETKQGNYENEINPSMISLTLQNQVEPSQYSTSSSFTTNTGMINLSLSGELRTSTLYGKISGPDDQWFAIGMDSVEMANTDTWVSECGGGLRDITLGNRLHGTDDLVNNLKIISEVNDSKTRTIEFVRPFNTSEEGDVVLTPDTTYNFIYAVGGSCKYTNHGPGGAGKSTIYIEPLEHTVTDTVTDYITTTKNATVVKTESLTTLNLSLVVVHIGFLMVITHKKRSQLLK